MTDPKEETEDVADNKAAPTGNLDDVFDGKDDETDEAEPAAKTEKEPEPKGDKPAAKEAEDDAEPPAAEDEEDDKGKSVPVAALKSERQKRQAAEAELERLKKERNSDTEDDDEDEASPDPKQELEQFAHRTTISRELMMEDHDDYEAMEKIFTEMGQSDPELVKQMMASKNPAKFAYETAKKSEKGQEYAEFLEFRKAKTNGKLKKPDEETPEAKRKKSALAVPNLNKVASVSSNSTPKEKLESLDEMFED